MKVSHRIVGDPPKCGFGYRASTKAFPSDIDAKWVRDAEDVRFSARLRPREGEGVSEVDSALEFQSVEYGRFAAVRSAMGMVPGARPHGYTDIALIEPAAGETLSAAQLLSFDRFIGLESFWKLDKSDTVLPDGIAPAEWTPARPVQAEGSALPEDERLLLALRYWKAASARLFAREAPQPVRVLLGMDDSKALAEEAKRFFLREIAPLLPPEAEGILSFSAGVRANAADKFRPTALVFLYPGDQAEQDGTVFAPGKPWIEPKNDEKTELEFLKAVQSGEGLKPVRALALSMRVPALVADFDSAFAAWKLADAGKRCGNAEKTMAVWRGLDKRLDTVFGIPDEKARIGVLAPLEEKAVSSLLNAESLPLSKEDLSFLGRRYLLSGEGASETMRALLVRYEEKAGENAAPFTVITEVCPEETDAAQEARLGSLFSAILQGNWSGTPLNGRKNGALTGEAFLKFCGAHTVCRDAVAEYLKSMTEKYGGQRIALLPLSLHYRPDAERNDAIRAALTQLKEQYVDPLPGREDCAALHAAAGKLDAGNEAILTEYHRLCFERYGTDYRYLGPRTEAMGFETAGVAQAILGGWAAPERAAGVTPEEVSALLEGLCLLDGQKKLKTVSGCEAVKEALASLVEARYLADGATALSWAEALIGFFGGKDPQPEELRTMAVCMRCGTAEAPLPEEDFDQAVNWLAGGACGQGTADACAALLKLCEQHCADGAGKAHAEKMIRARFVGSVEGYPALCALTKEAAAVDLTRALNADEPMPSCLRRADALCAKTRAADAGGKLSEALFLRPEVRGAAEGHFRRHMEENFTPEGLVGCAKELAETDYSPYPKVKTLGYGILYKEVMQNKDVLLQGTAGWRDWNGLRAFADRCRSLGACGAVPAKDFEMLGEAEAAIRALNGGDAFSAAPAGAEGIAKALDFGRKLLGAVGSGEIPLENAQAIGRLLRDATGEAVQNGPWAEMSAKDASMLQRAGMPFAARIAAALYGECAARDERRFPRLVKEMTGMEPGSAEKLGGDDAARVLMAVGALFRLLENAETEVPGAARDLLQEANAGDMVALRETLAKKADALMIRGINKGEYGADNAFTRWLGRGKTV